MAERNRRLWSKEDIVLVQTSSLTNKELAKILKRTEGAIKACKNYYKTENTIVKCSRLWTEEEIELALNSKATNKEIAKCLGRSLLAVKNLKHRRRCSEHDL